MKKLLTLLFVLAAVAVYASNTYDTWLNEEVKVIITKQEKDSFKSLKTDAEKDQFIKDFWAKRDPSPGTEVNEYKDNYEHLLEQVNEKVKSKRHKGFETDMGQTLLLLGPPDKMEDVGGKQNRPEVVGDDEDAEEPGTIGSQTKKKWMYEKLPKEVADGPVEITFEGDPSTGEWKFTDSKKSQAVLEKARAYPITASKMSAEDQEKFLAEQKKQQAAAEQQMMLVYGAPPSDAMKAVLDSTVAGNGPKDVVFDAVVDSFMTSKGEEFASIGVSTAADTSTAKVGVRILDSAGAVVKELEFPFQRGGEKPGYFQAQIPFSHGDEKIAVVVTSGDKSGGLVKTATLPDLASKLSLSSIIVAKSFDQIAEPKPEKEPYTFGRIKVHPQVDHTFAKADNLILTYEVYNMQVDATSGQPNLEQIIAFQKGKDKPQATPAQAPNGLVTAKKMTVPTSFPLANFPAGDYKLTITVTDKATSQTASSETWFIVK
jgi:GWxTD domain-containing protein